MSWHDEFSKIFEPSNKDLSGTVTDIYEELGYESAEQAYEEKFNVKENY